MTQSKLSPVFSAGKVALVTGAASGIGLAACERFAGFGMKVCMVDVDEDALAQAQSAVAEAAANDGDVIAMFTDVSQIDDMAALKARIEDAFGTPDLLFNNAVMREPAQPSQAPDIWRRNLEVNLWGVINGVQTFVPAMIAGGAPAMVVNSGSKQGITNPPGNAPYNVAKAALKSYTELLAHELRNTEGCWVSAHLLIPGMTTTGTREHRPGAWWPDQVIDLMIDALNAGDFYILCPDGEVTPEMDRKRILWGAGDIAENRAALSRWHPDYAEDFKAFAP